MGIILPQQDRILQSISLGNRGIWFDHVYVWIISTATKSKKEMSQSSLIGHSVLALKYVWHSCKLAVRLGQKISAHALCCDKKNFRHHFFSEYHVFLFQCWEFRRNILDIIVTHRKYKWKSNWPKNQQIGNALFSFSLLPVCFPTSTVHTYLLDVIKSLFICIFWLYVMTCR